MSQLSKTHNRKGRERKQKLRSWWLAVKLHSALHEVFITMLWMQIVFPYRVYFIVLSALERGLQNLQHLHQMLLGTKPPAASATRSAAFFPVFKLNQGSACLTLPQKIPQEKPKMLPGVILVRKLTAETAQVMDLAGWEEDRSALVAPRMGQTWSLHNPQWDAPHFPPRAGAMPHCTSLQNNLCCGRM